MCSVGQEATRKTAKRVLIEREKVNTDSEWAADANSEAVLLLLLVRGGDELRRDGVAGILTMASVTKCIAPAAVTDDRPNTGTQVPPTAKPVRPALVLQTGAGFKVGM